MYITFVIYRGVNKEASLPLSLFVPDSTHLLPGHHLQPSHSCPERTRGVRQGPQGNFVHNVYAFY